MESEDWKEFTKERQEKRWSNYDRAIKFLKETGVDFKEYANGHIQVGDFDYWATTGLFIHRQTKKRGRGIDRLLKNITSEV